MKKKPEDFTQAEVEAFQAAHADKSVKLTDYQARCLMADYEGDKLNDTGIIARDRLYEDMVASRKAAPSINSGKPPLDALRIPSYLEDPQAWSYLDYVARHGKDHPMDPLLMGDAPDSATDAVVLDMKLSAVRSPVLLDITEAGPQYGHQKTPITLRLQNVPRARKLLARAGIDADNLLSTNPSYETSQAFLALLKHQVPFNTPSSLKDALGEGDRALFRTQYVGANMVDVYPIGFENEQATPSPDFYADCRAIDDVAIPTGFKDLNSFGGFKRGELILARARRLGSSPARKALAHFMESTKPGIQHRTGLENILRNLADSRKHNNYRDKLQGAYRILHPKKDKEGRLLPVRARGESEARMIARPMRDAAMARALRVVARHEEIQRLRREQNKKQFKKVKRHRKAWQ